MSVVDDKADATCWVCDERVELYAPGESFKVREGRPVHPMCADYVDDEAIEREARR